MRATFPNTPFQGHHRPLGWKNHLVEPSIQGQIVTDTPKTAHGRVGVGVHQSRHDEMSGKIDVSPPPITAPEIGGGPHRNHTVRVDGHTAFRDDAHIRIAGHHPVRIQ